MTRGLRQHAAWGLLGAVAVPSLWYAWSVPGALLMFACIGLAFVLWYTIGSRGSWVALVVVGAGMSGLLAWESSTGSRCPEGDSRVQLKEGKPEVGCDELRASAAAMGVFFGLVALFGLAVPIYAREGADVRDADPPDGSPR